MNGSPLVFATLLVATHALADFEAPTATALPTVERPSSRPWELTLRAAIGHNDNVQLVPTSTTFPAGGNTSADFYTLQGDASYRFFQSANVVSGLTLNFSSLWHEDKQQTPAWKFSDYNFYSINPGVYSSYRHSLGGLPGVLTVSYDFLKEDGHNSELHALGLTSHILKVAESVTINPKLIATATLSRAWDNFSVVFPSPSLDSRDATRTSLDLGVRYWLNGGLHNVGAGIGYTDNHAEGRNFRYDGYNLRLRFETGALRPIWLAAEVKYSDRDYLGFTSGWIPAPGRTSQQITTTLLQALWPITRQWSADLFVKHDQYDANQAEFEADATVYGAGLSYRF